MTILVTGATRGIGRALVIEARARGLPVIGTHRGRAPDAGPDLAGVEWQALEITDPEAHRALAARLAGRPLAGLICNAGVLLDGQESLETGYPADLWARMFAVNVTGVFLTIQALLPNLRAGPGKIAIISSGMGSSTRAQGGNLIYRATKAAVLNLGRNLGMDLAASGIPVGIYDPGWVQTDMGGTAARLEPARSAAGLLDRLAALSPATSGCFETGDGRPQPF